MTDNDGSDPTRRIRRSRAKLINRLRVQAGRCERALKRITYERRAVEEVITATGGKPPAPAADPDESGDSETAMEFIDHLHGAARRAMQPDSVATTTLERDLVFLTLTADALEEAADHAA